MTDPMSPGAGGAAKRVTEALAEWLVGEGNRDDAEVELIESARDLVDAVAALRLELGEARVQLAKWPTIDCPCCGDVGAWADSFTEDTPSTCGCGGRVSIGDPEEPAYISVDECVNPVCLAEIAENEAAVARAREEAT